MCHWLGKEQSEIYPVSIETLSSPDVHSSILTASKPNPSLAAEIKSIPRSLCLAFLDAKILGVNESRWMEAEEELYVVVEEVEPLSENSNSIKIKVPQLGSLATKTQWQRGRLDQHGE